MTDGVDALLEDIEEDLRRERMEKLWKQYGSLVIAGAFLIVLATAAYSGWQQWQTRQRQIAGAALFDALDPTEKAVSPVQAASRLGAVAKRYPHSVQETVARMMQAGMLMRANDKPAAIKLYQSLSDDPATPAAFRSLATIFLVELQLDTGKPADLEKRLEPLQPSDSPWHFSALEFGAIAEVRNNDIDRAHMMLEQLTHDSEAPADIRERAEEMLRTLPLADPRKAAAIPPSLLAK